MKFPEKMRTLLRRRGLSARALAGKLELSNSTVAGWLKTSRPQAAQAKQVAECLGVPVDILLDDAADLPAEPSPTVAAKKNRSRSASTLEEIGEVPLNQITDDQLTTWFASHPDDLAKLFTMVLRDRK